MTKAESSGSPYKNDPDITCGMTDNEMDYRFTEAVRLAIEKQKIKKQPIARYDVKNDVAYLEYPDGHREFVNDPELDEIVKKYLKR